MDTDTTATATVTAEPVRLTRSAAHRGQRVRLIDRGRREEWTGLLDGWGPSTVSIRPDEESKERNGLWWKVTSFGTTSVDVFALDAVSA